MLNSFVKIYLTWKLSVFAEVGDNTNEPNNEKDSEKEN